jgi:integrase
MSSLRQSLEDYLRIRRGLGYKLVGDGQALSRYLDYLEERGEGLISAENALAWARLPAGADPDQWARRLTYVRRFAAYLNALDPAHEVPPADLLPPARTRRATPYLYSAQELAALLAATSSLRAPLRAATYRTLIGLLAVTGMRLGEAIALDIGDVDWSGGVLTIREGKFDKTRALPLHPSTVTALEDYLRVRETHRAAPGCGALFISRSGKRLLRNDVGHAFRTLVKRAGLRPRSARCRPRVHDLRHTFAVATLLEWYRSDVDVAPRLPLLSTYLGHVHPRHTYWYLHAAPELLALAAGRLERSTGGER